MTQPGGPAPTLPGPQDDTAYPRPGYAWYVLGVLTLVYMFSFLDRQILNLLVAPVRRDLHISDTQMSLLSGFAFALFYVAFGIPLGRVADSRSRTNLITAGFATWSLFTAGCGLAASYGQLLVMRMGVGIGEASLGPAAYSLITDYFPPNRRARAQGIYNMGRHRDGRMVRLHREIDPEAQRTCRKAPQRTAGEAWRDGDAEVTHDAPLARGTEATWNRRPA